MLELFSILTVVVDVEIYTYDKIVYNLIHINEYKLNLENLNKISELYHYQYSRYFIIL